MKASLLNQWFSGNEINAICWTLIHSLWIGLIIALLCGVIIATTRRSAATLRYRLLCSLLVVFVCAIGVTYYLEAGSVPALATAGKGETGRMLIKSQGDVVINRVIIPPNQTLLNSLQASLNQNANIIVLVWLLFFVLKSLKMVSGLLYIQRIRNYKVHKVTEELKHRIEHFSSQIGIRRPVRLVQSELVKVPVAIGWLKPMILLPVGIAFQLTPEQLDGILWHELAHICRRDYLVNILQGLVETVFFFNPGLLWLSSLIRAEREACCDDIVLSRTNRKANYLEALLSFGYENNSRTTLAMSIGSGNQLRDRLKRMINQENKRLSVAEKAVLGIGLVLLSAFTTMPKAGQAATSFAGTVGKTISAIIKKHGDKAANVAKAQAIEKQLSGEPEKTTGKIISKTADTAIRFTSVLFKHSDADLANNDISAMDDKGNKYHFIVAGNKLTGMEVNGVKVGDDKLAGYGYMIRYIDNEVATKRRVMREDIAAYKANSPAVKFKGKDTLGYSKRKDVAAKQPVDKFKRKDTAGYSKRKDVVAKQPVDKISPKQYDKQRYVDGQEPEARYMKTEGMRRRAHEDSITYAAQEERALGVVTDLVKEKVVPNAASVKWFGLSDTELIVNGQKQPQELQQKLKAKYGIHENYGLYYGPAQMTGTGIFIDGPDRLARPSQPERPAPPTRHEGPTPKYMGAVEPNKPDSAAWKLRQLIKQQQLFSADQNEKRQQLMKQQQLFAAEQNDKRAQLILQQQLLLAKQWRTPKSGIDLQPAITGIISDLVSANVISDKSDLIKFNLTNSALLVNGKKQPNELHEKLKAKYLEQPNYSLKFGITDDPDFGLHFNAQTNSMGLGITKGPDSP